MRTATGEDTGTCPCCKGKHNRYVHTVLEKITLDGRNIVYNAEYSYCPFASEYYETEEQFRDNLNAFRRMRNSSKPVSEYISQEDITRLLLLFGDRTEDGFASHDS